VIVAAAGDLGLEADGAEELVADPGGVEGVGGRGAPGGRVEGLGDEDVA
jgi:hypothetical protein